MRYLFPHAKFLVEMSTPFRNQFVPGIDCIKNGGRASSLRIWNMPVSSDILYHPDIVGVNMDRKVCPRCGHWAGVHQYTKYGPRYRCRDLSCLHSFVLNPQRRGPAPVYARAATATERSWQRCRRNRGLDDNLALYKPREIATLPPCPECQGRRVRNGVRGARQVCRCKKCGRASSINLSEVVI